MTEAQGYSPSITWEFGTAYELFISLHVLHEPDRFGLRPSWAAGVRSRIPANERKLLEDVYPIIGLPLKWLQGLPKPKDAVSALWALKQIPPVERMPTLQRLNETHQGDDPAEMEKHEQYRSILTRVASEGKWTSDDVDFFTKIFSQNRSIKRDAIERCLDWWSRPKELGEGFLSALQSYYQAFFEEEEKRVGPILRAALEQAQGMASTMSIQELFLELSQGLQLGGEFNASNLIIAPAFWTTPLLIFEKFDKDTMFLLYGARPSSMSVVPGETVPDALIRSLKALADPTRLKILYYLSNESLTPSEIARKLKLRPPTVTHHLSELRLASLVEFSINHDDNRYTVRKQALESIFGNLQDFLQNHTPDE
jgi:DNA-binding transcriptional ArsR family regulator